MNKCFVTEGVKSSIDDLIQQLGMSMGREREKVLKETLIIIRKNPEKFDENCQANISWFDASRVSSYLSVTGDSEKREDEIQSAFALIYRFVVEFDLSVDGDVSRGLRDFMEYAELHVDEFHGNAKQQIKYAGTKMPINICKALLGSEAISNIRNLGGFSNEIGRKIDGWGKEIGDTEERARMLKENLEKYEVGFNFVGLHKGFSNLADDKRWEVRRAAALLFLLAGLSMLPILWELHRFAQGSSILAENFASIVLSFLPIISISAIFLYFFRVVNKNFNDAKAQLLQLELRKSLCQFIQSYAEYASKMRTGNSDLLVKFESLIFSGVVGTTEAIPGAFDGIEKLASLIKSAKS